ncbi:MAG: hypothetical protein ACLPL7_24285, partial [Pseudomonas sp.]
GWLNLVEITAFFEDMSYEEAGALASVVSDCWNATLVREFPESGFISKFYSRRSWVRFMSLCVRPESGVMKRTVNAEKSESKKHEKKTLAILLLA